MHMCAKKRASREKKLLAKKCWSIANPSFITIPHVAEALTKLFVSTKTLPLQR